MTTYVLWISARLENLTNFQPNGGVDDESFTYLFKIRCTCCGEESTKEVCLSLDEREFHTRQEPEVHLVKKCQGCKLTGTITMTPGQGFPLSNSLSRRGRAAALMRFRCVGYEPYGFISNGLWRAERMDGTPITHIDIKMGPLTYPEDDGEPSASISDVVFEFRQAR
ncbi:UPF0587 protein [Tanacetum coccineum]